MVFVAGAVSLFGACGHEDGRQDSAAPQKSMQPSAPPHQANPQSPPARSQAHARKPAEAEGEPPPPTTIPALIEEATQVADRLVESFPDDCDAHEVRARILFLLGRNAEASGSWERSLELNPEYAYGYHGLGLIAAKEGEYEKAVTLQRKALTHVPGFSEAAHKLCDALLKLGKIEEAIEALHSHISVVPESTETYVYLGQAHVAGQQYEKAADAFETALERYPDIPRAQYGLATALARLGRREEADEAMNQYRLVRAKDMEVRTQYSGKRDDMEALAVDFAARYVLAGRVYLVHGVLREAERLCRRAAVLDPANTECRVVLASLYQQTGRGADALRTCRELVAIAPDQSAYHLNLGVMYSNLGRFDDSEQSLQEAIRLAPQAPEGYVSLTRLYLRSDRELHEAVRLAESAFELRAVAANAFLLSQVRAGVGDHAGAVSAIEEAIRLDPENKRYQQARTFLQEKR